MDKYKKITHLKTLKGIVDRMIVNDNNIYELESIITDEYHREINSKDGSNLYVKQLKGTINKQLKMLIKNKDKPKNRIVRFKETKDSFISDIERELGNLKYI